MKTRTPASKRASSSTVGVCITDVEATRFLGGREWRLRLEGKRKKEVVFVGGGAGLKMF